MSKLIIKPTDIKKLEKSKRKERVTIQLRAYDARGCYDKSQDMKSNETIWIKDCQLSRAYEIIKTALLNSRLISSEFEVD